MSRGPGKLQQEILAYLRGQTQPVTVESMRWTLYAQAGEGQVANGGLPSAWNSSIARAVKNLASTSRRLVKIERRPLATLQEWVDHYPNKTLKADIRTLRLQLLPVLVQWTAETTGPGPQHTSAANEQFFAESIPQDYWPTLCAQWKKIEKQLRPIYTASGSNDLFLLMVKGKFFFEKVEVNSRHSLRQMVEVCCRSQLLPHSLVTELRNFIAHFLPPQTAGALELKSFVHRFAHVPDHGQCRLRDATMAELHARQPAIVESLPGFKPAKGKSHEGFVSLELGDLVFPRPAIHSPLLRRLVDHTVFQKYNFLTVAPERPIFSVSG